MQPLKSCVTKRRKKKFSNSSPGKAFKKRLNKCLSRRMSGEFILPQFKWIWPPEVLLGPTFWFLRTGKKPRLHFQAESRQRASGNSNLGLQVHPKCKQAQPEGCTYPLPRIKQATTARASMRSGQPSELAVVVVRKSGGRGRNVQGSCGCGSL